MQRKALAAFLSIGAILFIGSRCTTMDGDMPREPNVTVAQTEAAPGASVTVTAEGFPPDTEVVVGAGPPQSEYDVIERARTDAQGRLQRTVAMPRAAESHREYVFVVATPDARTKAVSRRVDVVEEQPRSGAITVTGVITQEGVECLAMRGDDGKLYTLGRPQEQYAPGTRVRVTGTIAEMSFCMQGITINPTKIERL